jgi:hypothetical protein
MVIGNHHGIFKINDLMRHILGLLCFYVIFNERWRYACCLEALHWLQNTGLNDFCNNSKCTFLCYRPMDRN